MAVMVPVVVVAVVGVASSQIVLIVQSGIMMMIMVVIMIMKARSRYFVTQMPVHALYRRPDELERDKQHEQDGEEVTHGGSLADYPAEAIPIFRKGVG